MARISMSGSGGPLFLLLFSIPFTAVGIGMLVVTWWTLWDWQRMQCWEEVPCQILSAKLESHRGDDSTTYKVVAEYRYRYAGRDYTGTRVSPHSGADNIGSFHQRAYKQLDRHRTSGKPFPCYVDPEHPEEAILYRRPRWEMMLFYTGFLYAFGGAGLGTMLGGLLWRRSRSKRAATPPDEPWLARDDWARGLVSSSNRKTFLVVAMGAVFANLPYLPAAMVAYDAWITGSSRWALLTMIFPAIGLALAWWALYAGLRWVKYGESTFQMASVPGVVGGTLAGVVHVASRLQSEHGFRVRLVCHRTVTKRSGKKTETTVDTAWEQVRQIAKALDQPDPGRTAIPILFGLPYDVLPTGEEGDRTIAWQLEVRSAQSGVDYKAVFEVPIFRTAQSRPDFQLDDSLMAPYSALDAVPNSDQTDR